MYTHWPLEHVAESWPERYPAKQFALQTVPSGLGLGQLYAAAVRLLVGRLVQAAPVWWWGVVGEVCVCGCVWGGWGGKGVQVLLQSRYGS